MTLDDWFRSSVTAFPHEVALEIRDQVLTYAELDALAGRLAADLVRGHGGAPSVLGLMASRTVTAYAGFLAALRLGATVVPLNPASPASRNLAGCAAAGVDLILSDAGARPPFPEPFSPSQQAPALPEDIAYILFTSGSTGSPKGVPVSHANLHAYLTHQIARFPVGPGCRFSQNFDLTFDPSIFDLFVAWGSGSAVVVPDRHETLAPVAFVNERRITHWFSVPSVVSMAQRLGGLPPGSMPSLSRSLFIGERLTLEQAAAWSEAAPNSTVENMYGPTELTISCASYRLPAERADWPTTRNGTVPIGPIDPHLEAVLLDGDTVSQTEGELCVRGAQRFPGYLCPKDNHGRFTTLHGSSAMTYDGNEPLTDKHWYKTGDRVHVNDGSLVFLGRTDDQIKLRGHRIEPGEIEASLRRHTSVHDVAVLALPATDGELELIAAYTGDRTPPSSLATKIHPHLPAHMIPANFVHFNELPLNENGKLDRPRIAATLREKPA